MELMQHHVPVQRERDHTLEQIVGHADAGCRNDNEARHKEQIYQSAHAAHDIPLARAKRRKPSAVQGQVNESPQREEQSQHLVQRLGKGMKTHYGEKKGKHQDVQKNPLHARTL